MKRVLGLVASIIGFSFLLLACLPETTSPAISSPPVVATRSMPSPATAAPSQRSFLPTSPERLETKSTRQPTPSPISTPAPTSSRSAGWLVFSSVREDANGDGQLDLRDSYLYWMDLSTQEVTQLTFGRSGDTQPSWSPDRSQVVFVSGRGEKGNHDLFVINTDGSGLRQLTDTPENEAEPRWSPDGMEIAYTRYAWESGMQKSDIFLISVDGNWVRQLTEGARSSYRPSWSPDGRFLTFEQETEEMCQRIYLWDRETESISYLDMEGTTSPAVSYFAPLWVPRAGLFLSVNRIEIGGDSISSQILVFEMLERDGKVEWKRTSVDAETNLVHYTWGANGEWLIAPSNSSPYLSDLLQVGINWTGPSRACWKCTGLIEPQLLTEHNVYDDFPDWAP